MISYNDVITGMIKSAKKKELVTERMLITPDFAIAAMERNSGNRNISSNSVECYALDMKNNRWKYTAEPIAFSWEGKLINGQHRMAACILADTPFEALIVWGLDPITPFDVGRARKASDILQIYRGDIKQPRNKASIAKLLIGYYTRTGFPSGINRVVSKQEIPEFVIEHDDLLSVAVNRGGAFYKTHGRSLAIAGACYYIFSEIDAVLADSYFDSLASMADLEPNKQPLMYRGFLGT